VKLEGLFNRRREDRPSGHEPRYVFVVTYGRSGSTLTQGLLNALPGTLVRGENNMFMLPFFRSWAGVREFQEKNNDNAINNGSRSAFYGLDEIDPEDFVQASRALTLQALYGSADRSKVKVLGYKEVLWHRIKRDEVEEFFGWFEQIFPGASYVLNQRDHESVRKSGFWQNQEEQRVMRTLRRVEDMQQFLRETRPDRTHDVRYERITSEDQSVKDKELRGLAEFVVGSCDDKVLKNMHDTLGQGHGPRPFGRSRGQAEESEDGSVSDSSE
jgi:hypothetical protein